MVNFMVERATSEVLVGPDWAKNTEICEILNHYPGQVKGVVKAIKKKLKSKNSKVQFLALSLLETMLSNCGDTVHMHVADRNILPEMVRIYKKRSNFTVKEKILILVDTWQEAFGGARARYPQYFVAYQDLLRAGAIFPQRTVRSPPNFRNVHNSDQQQEMEETSAEPEFPTLSLTELESARTIMNVLSEMLSALDPGNKEGLEQEVLVDLVEQCRTFKHRVVHFVNSTSDESLLDQGLALNDDLQRVLAKHQSLASGTSSQSDKQTPEPANVDGLLVDTGDISIQSNERSISGTSASSQPGSITPAAANPILDLLSFDDDNSPEVDNSLALVPLGEPQQTTPGPHNALVLLGEPQQTTPGPHNALVPSGEPQQTTPGPHNALVPLGEPQQTTPGPHNDLVPFDMFSDSYTQGLPGQTNTLTPQTQQQQHFHVNGTAPNMQSPQFEQLYDQGSDFAWNSQLDQQQQGIVPFYGTQYSYTLPPPPWEEEGANSSPVEVAQYPQSQYYMGNDQVVGMYIQPTATGNLPAINNNQATIQGNQFADFHPQQNQGAQYMAMVPYQMTSYPQQMYGNPQMGASGYGQQQYLDQQMHGLSIRDDNGYQVLSSSYVPPSSKPSKPEDKMFGDLVDMARVKSTATTPGTTGKM